MQEYKRGRMLINPGFQLRIIGYAMLLGVILVTALYSVNVFFFSRFVEQGLAMGLPADHIYFQFIAQQKAAMSQSFLGVAVFVLSILAAWALVISHRIAGPIYNLCNKLVAMKNDGKVREIRFRKKDFFPELQDAVNAVISDSKSSKSKSA